GAPRFGGGLPAADGGVVRSPPAVTGGPHYTPHAGTAVPGVRSMRTILLLLSAVALFALAACARDSAPATDATTDTSPEAAAVDPADDEYSYAEPKKVKTTELALDLAVDFDQQQISGTATYTLDWLHP